jgi:phytoene dehydrogenase-like protein
VALESGEELHTKIVLSAADPKRTFLKFVEPKYFPDDFLASIRNFRVRGSSGKLNLALSELPDFTALPGENALHRGAISEKPYLEVTTTENVISIHFQFAPYNLREGSWKMEP